MNKFLDNTFNVDLTPVETTTLDEAIFEAIKITDTDDVQSAYPRISFRHTEPTIRTVVDQAGLDAIPDDFTGTIRICGGTIYNPIIITKEYGWPTHVEVKGNSYVHVCANGRATLTDNSVACAYGYSKVAALDNSYVCARDNTYINAIDNAVVDAHDYCNVTAYKHAVVLANSKVEVVAHDNTNVCLKNLATCSAFNNAVVDARDGSRVRAWDKSTVTACGDVVVTKMCGKSKVKVSGNAIVIKQGFKDIYDFMGQHGVKHGKTYATFYKAVHKSPDGRYFSDWQEDFEYKIGETIIEICDDDIYETCSNGLHAAPLDWVLDYGHDWPDLAIIEVKIRIDSIVLPKESTGKIRTNKLKVIREVPLTECGPIGAVIAMENKLYNKQENE